VCALLIGQSRSRCMPAAAYLNVIPSTSMSEDANGDPHNTARTTRRRRGRGDDEGVMWRWEGSTHHQLVRDGATLAPTGSAFSEHIDVTAS
jgi:hypothetical protein